jgi:hypothetical protein
MALTPFGGGIGAVASLAEAIFKWVTDPNGYETLSTDLKLDRLREATNKAMDAKDWTALDYLIAEYRRISSTFVAGVLTTLLAVGLVVGGCARVKLTEPPSVVDTTQCEAAVRTDCVSVSAQFVRERRNDEELIIRLKQALKGCREKNGH